jgi:hypothetical protein
MALEGDIKVPGGGKVPKKAAAAGLLIVGTLIGVYYYKKRKSPGTAAAAAAATTTDQFPPDGTFDNPQDPYSTDSATGQTYGNEAVGSGGTFGAFGTGSSLSQGGGGGTTASGTGGPPFSDNAAWSNWVIPQLQAVNPNTDTGALTDAIGLYLHGQPVSPAQKTLIFDATAIGGDPPVAGPNGYPPKVMLNGSSTGPVPPGPPAGGGGGKPPPRAVARVTVPVTFGERAETAMHKIQSAGFTVSTSPARDPGHTYVSTGSKPEGGTKAAKGSHVTLGVKIGK